MTSSARSATTRALTASMPIAAAYSQPSMVRVPTSTAGLSAPLPKSRVQGTKVSCSAMLAVRPPSLMPLTLDLSHALLEELARIRKEELHLMPYLRPDAKSQVTVEYSEEGKPLRIDTIVISTQHDDFIQPTDATTEAQAIADAEMQARITEDIRRVLLPRVFARYPEDVQRAFDRETKLLVNPTGKFVIGGPHGDTGLTGRKIIVDTYGGKAAHGGGAFSGKDPLR